MFKQLVAIIVFASLVSLLSGGTAPQDPAGSEIPALAAGSGKIGSKTFQSAFLHVWVREAYNHEVNLHRITAAWSEMDVTWANFGGSFDPTIEASFIADAVGWHVIDVSTVVEDWLGGGTNHGFLFDQETGYPPTVYNSRERTTEQPYLELNYATSTGTLTEQFLPAADSYIWEPHPNHNGGSSANLYTGFQDSTGQEKQTMMRFELLAMKTRTPGYWKTHSSYGPAPYDRTWADLPDGADTGFFLSDQTYYEVLWTSPKGNVYYILSRAWIAAELNMLAGCSIPPEVLEIWSDATDLFDTYTPDEIKKLKGNDPLRQEFIYLAGILDDFNNGIE